MMSGVYLATMMVLTTTATVLAVLVLRVHHQVSHDDEDEGYQLVFLETVSTKIAKCYEQVRRGLPVPPAVRAMAWWAF